MSTILQMLNFHSFKALQENRARCNQYTIISIRSMSAIFSVGMVLRTVYTSLQCAQSLTSLSGFICEIYSEINVKTPHCVTQIILRCSVIADAKLLEIHKHMLEMIEKWSRNICFVRNQKRSETLGLSFC